MTKKLDEKDRREKILRAALSIAEKKGYSRITRDEIAAKADCATGLVSYHFATMPQLKRAVMRFAVAEGNAVVVGQGLGAGDTYAKKAPADLKQKALALLS